MSLPSDLTVTLPPTFATSFWSHPDYRPGAQVLYARLQRGLDDDARLLALVRHRAAHEYAHAEALATPAPLPSLKSPLISGVPRAHELAGPPHSATSYALRTLESETTTAHAAAHGKIARALERTILDPFGKWSAEHEDRVRSSWEHVDAALSRFEKQKAEVRRLQDTYEAKCRHADEAEDDARFAPAPVNGGASHDTEEKEKVTLSDDPRPATTQDPLSLQRRETLRAQFGFANKGRKAAPESAKNEFGGVELPTSSVSAGDIASDSRSIDDPEGSPRGPLGALRRSATLSSYLSKAVDRINEAPALAPLRGALGGLTEPRHLRIRRDAENAEAAYATAVRTLDRNRCSLEEILTEHYGLAQRWEGDRTRAVTAVLDAYSTSFSSLLPMLSASLGRSHGLVSTLNPDADVARMIYDSRTGSYRPAPEVFHAYYHDSTDPASLAGGGTGGFGMDLVTYSRSEALAREELATAEGTAGRGGDLEKSRRHIPSSNMPTVPLVLSALLGALKNAYADASKWPTPSQGDDAPSALLAASAEKRKAWIYEVPLTASHRLRQSIISHVEQTGVNAAAGIDAVLTQSDAPVMAATVKLWALELDQSLVPSDLWDQIDNLYRAAAAQERDALRSLQGASEDTVKGEDAPSSDAKKETLGEESADAKEEGKVAPSPVSNKGKTAEGKPRLDPATADKIRKDTLSDLAVVLGKLPLVHLVCLDAVISHLRELVKATTTDEPDIKYLSKLGLSLGRSILRPRQENARTLPSRAPALLVMDLVAHYETLFPDLVAQKARDAEANAAAQRRMPVRKRTKPIDQRISRSSIQRAAADAPPVPPAKENIDEKATVTPIVTESTNTAAGSSSTDSDIPTPIADRVLAGAAAPSTLSVTDAELRSASPAQSSSAYGSALASPVLGAQSSGADDAQTPASSAPSISATGTSSSSSSSKDDAPLSNVQRLSRQFGAATSTTGVRGPRPAGARAGRAGVSSTDTHSATSAAAAIPPGVERGDDTKAELPEDARNRRRRSWSRSVQPSDHLVEGSEDTVE